MVKAAVVGVGYLGKFHAEKYKNNPNCELVAVVDVDSSAAKKCAKRLKTQALGSYKELPNLGVTCASVASSTSSHYEIASWLLENGVDVLVEKPMATSIAEAQSLIQIAKENGRILQAGHLERFNPAFRAMKDIMNKPRFFEVRRIAQFKGRGHDVDVVLDLMIHDIDIVSHLVGRPLLRVEAVGIPVVTETNDIANARLTFEGGAVANVTASRAAFKSERSVRVFQQDAYMSLDFEKKKLKIYRRKPGTSIGGLPKIDISETKIKERDALEHEIDSFLQTVISRGVPEVTGEDGLRALQFVERIHSAFAESLQLLDAEDIEMTRAVANA